MRTIKLLSICVGLIIASLASGCAPVMASPASDARQGAETEMHHYKAAYPDCEACGAKDTILHRNEVHHIIPCATAPQNASNGIYITLCRPCHICLGHCGDAACRRYCPNIREVLAVRIVKENQ